MEAQNSQVAAALDLLYGEPMPVRKNKRLSEPEEMTVKILIVDDHPVVRQGLRMFIETDESFQVVGEAAGAEEALGILNREEIDLATVDIALEGEASGLDLVRVLRTRFPRLRLLVLSMYDENLYAERALRAGARGYIMKKEAQANITDAIHRIMEGNYYLSDRVADKIITRSLMGDSDDASEATPTDVLGSKEFEVFQLIGRGLNSREIAEKLNISKNTVDSHKRNIKEKLNLSTSGELIKYAVHWMLTQEK